MSRLPLPLRKVLSADVEVVTTHRVWQRISARRSRRARVSQRLALAAAFVIGAAAAILFVMSTRQGALEGYVATSVREAGPLGLRGGATWAHVDSRVERRVIELDDGSRIELGPEARLTLLENTGHSVVTLLGAGRALFDIVPGGPRRWSIEAGLATVEVVGTRFSVARDKSGIEVEVEHGVVLVRGERVNERVQRLGAGDRLRIDQEPAAPESPPARPSAPGELAPLRPDRAPRFSNEAAWRDMATRGDYDDAYKSLTPSGIAANAKTADLEGLLALADVARLSGHPAEAVEPLERVLSEHRRDPRAALAAFTLGRLFLDSLGDAARAAKAFEQAMGLELPRALIEDAHLRLIEARARAGDKRGAHDAWVAYVARFPNSARRPVADRWGNPP
jgi:transmembrane sensor